MSIIKIYILFSFMTINYSLSQVNYERIYKSSDNVTGGFNNFTLELKSAGTLIINIESSKIATATDSGNHIVPIAKQIFGTLIIKNETISFILDRSNIRADSIFSNSDWSHSFNKKPVLFFSKSLDTAFIFGVPCSLIKK